VKNPSKRTPSEAPPPLAKCGFNQNPLFYCPVREGDSPFYTVFNKYFTFMHTVNEQQLCHVNSPGFDVFEGEDWGCWELRK